MALSAADIRAAWRLAIEVDALFRTESKTDLATIFSAVDAWCDANAASFNSSIQQPQRANWTTQQKSIALAYVALKRTGVL